MAGGAPPIEPAIHCAARSFAVVSVAVALVIVAAGIRLQHLADIDLYGDEALTAEIASSLWQHGELNPFRFSRFLPDWYFRNGIFIYFPPLSYVVAAPFTALVGVAGPNIAPRLPALISGLVLIALLIPAGRAVFADTGVGVAAAALTVCNGFQIGMSRTALPYSLLPPLLLLTLLALLRANRRDGVADWIAVTLGLGASAYINQVALLFWALILPSVLMVSPRRRLRLGICAAAAAGAFLLWVVLLSRRAFFANAFFQTTAGYRFGAQLGMIAAPYRQMLAPWPLAIVFAIGLGRLAYEAVRRRAAAKILLLSGLLLPGAMLLTRSMWIIDYHLFFVYPAVILVAAYGARTALLPIAARLRRHPSTARLDAAAFAAVVAALCGLEWWLAPPAPPRSASEFGSAQIVSAAAAYIRSHGGGEVVIAPVGMAEAYYLQHFVHTKNHPRAVAECLGLVSRGPAWVFMGDNYFRRGELDACDQFVRQHGTLFMHAAPIESWTDPDNPVGYALYRVEAPAPGPSQ